METIIIVTAILQSIGVSLGVGSSTLAITNFFVALSDGKIDDSERRMMGIVYIVLRIAMVLILTTTATLTLTQYMIYGSTYFTPFVVGFWILIVVLFMNALLMTLHLMPSTVGPSLQAASWYTMGVLMALFSLNLYQFDFSQFIAGYVGMILFATFLVNTILILLKRKKSAT
jgi:hypothetical protein